MQILTVLVISAAGVGQATFIESISQVGLIPTRGHDADAPRVEMGQTQLDEHNTLNLLGVTGHNGFRFVWNIMALDAIGVVLLIDTALPDALPQAQPILDDLRTKNAPIIIASHERHAASTLSATDLAVLGLEARDIHLVALDKPDSVRAVLLALIARAQSNRD